MKKTVVVVDDSESIREMMRFTLENAGYKVLLSQSASEALNYLNGREIDLILTDLYMPEVDGLSLTRQIRASTAYPFVPILVITTESQIARKEEARLAGATGWIVKPFTHETLIAIIQKLIR